MKRFLLIWLALFPAIAVFATFTPGLYQVEVSSTLNVRDAPNGAKIGSLSDGALVQVIACENGWAQISLEDGRMAYVSEQYIVPFSSPTVLPKTSYSSVSFNKLRHYTPFAVLLFAILTCIGLYTDCKPLFFLQVTFYGVRQNCLCLEAEVKVPSSGFVTLLT